jgi:hypothetical protein
MDTHRFRSVNGRRPTSVQISGTNFKTTVFIGVGVVTLFTGIILIVAYGLPEDIPQKPRSVSGAVVCAVGVLILLIGSVYAYIQNRKKRRRLRARARFMKVRTLAQVAPAFKQAGFARKISSQTSSSPTQISLVGLQSPSGQLHQYGDGLDNDYHVTRY